MASEFHTKFLQFYVSILSTILRPEYEHRKSHYRPGVAQRVPGI